MREAIIDVEAHLASPLYLHFLRYGFRDPNSLDIFSAAEINKHVQSTSCYLWRVLSDMVQIRTERKATPKQRLNREMHPTIFQSKCGNWQFFCEERLWDDRFLLNRNNVVIAEWQDADNIKFATADELAELDKSYIFVPEIIFSAIRYTARQLQNI